MSNSWLLSYPRSGNTWVRYITENILQCPTIGYWPDGPTRAVPSQVNTHKYYIDSPICYKATWGEEVDSASKPILKRHFFKDMSPETGDKLLFIIRNHKECILRHTMPVIAEFPERFLNVCYEELLSYMQNLQAYDEYPGPKLLVYYEDLLSTPEQQILEIIDFLGENSSPETLERYHKFLKDYGSHTEESRQIYAKNGVPPITNGKSELVFYSNLRDPGNTSPGPPMQVDHRNATHDLATIVNFQTSAVKIDTRARHYDENLYVKYLSRYTGNKNE